MDSVRMNLPALDVMKSISPSIPSPIASATRATGATAADSTPAARRFQERLGAMLVKEMRSTLPEGFFGGGAGSDVYGGWLDEHVGAALAKRDALHLEGAVRASLDRKARQMEEKS